MSTVPGRAASRGFAWGIFATGRAEMAGGSSPSCSSFVRSRAEAARERPASAHWGRPFSSGGTPFIPSFYLVTDHENPAQNKQPVPSSISQFDPDKPACWVLHGIFGGGKNWIPFVKNYLAKDLPGWQFVLVDVRGHGESR